MLARELDIITSAAREAGSIALGYQGRALRFEEKPDGQGPVSEADLAVNDFLVARFKEALPECAILSEEMEDDLKRLEKKRVLVIDPIDGTKAFLDNQGDFAISIGLVEGDEVVLGVIYAPAHHRLYFGTKGGGAFCDEVALQVSGEHSLATARILASRARYNRAAIDKTPALATVFRSSIALRLALVAAGEFDLTFALRSSWDWDIAAGDLLIREAGGALVDQAGDAPKYNQKQARQNGIVGGVPVLVEDFLKRLE